MTTENFDSYKADLKATVERYKIALDAVKKAEAELRDAKENLNTASDSLRKHPGAWYEEPILVTINGIPHVLTIYHPDHWDDVQAHKDVRLTEMVQL